MPWKETSVMDQKVQLISDWLGKGYNIAILSRIYGVSRPTVYKWIRRYEVSGIDGLQDLSRAPLCHPNATSTEVIEAIKEIKLKRQRWGPKKILIWLKEHHPERWWPSASTIGGVLKREGLVQARKRRRRVPAYTEPFKDCDESNQVWSADYKGRFKTQDQRYCYPLTITDNHSRYLLECRGLQHPSFVETQPWFEWVFRKYGLPYAIRTDNGPPFASAGLGGLSRLSVWFIKLGIIPERIDPGCPAQNGRHERMHRTLKEHTTNPPGGNLLGQQEMFERFKYEYNYERPHEALGQKSPSSVYTPSSRAYSEKIPKIEYDEGVEARYIHKKGWFKWKGKSILLTKALAYETVALEQTDDHLWEIRFNSYKLAKLNEKTGKIEKH
jgi:transposase InsO family protein